jgi:hypothetical protein
VSALEVVTLTDRGQRAEDISARLVGFIDELRAPYPAAEAPAGIRP